MTDRYTFNNGICKECHLLKAGTNGRVCDSCYKVFLRMHFEKSLGEAMFKCDCGSHINILWYCKYGVGELLFF